MPWKSLTKFGAFAAWAVGIIGGVVGLYVFYTDTIRQDPMFEFIDSNVAFAERVDRTGLPVTFPLPSEEEIRAAEPERLPVPHQRIEVEFRFTNTSDGPVSPRFLSFHDVQDEPIDVDGLGICGMGGSDLPSVFEPDETARRTCVTAWVPVPPREEGASIFTQSPVQQAAMRICSVRLWLGGDGNSDGLDRAFDFGSEGHRERHC